MDIRKQDPENDKARTEASEKERASAREKFDKFKIKASALKIKLQDQLYLWLVKRLEYLIKQNTASFYEVLSTNSPNPLSNPEAMGAAAGIGITVRVARLLVLPLQKLMQYLVWTGASDAARLTLIRPQFTRKDALYLALDVTLLGLTIGAFFAGGAVPAAAIALSAAGISMAVAGYHYVKFLYEGHQLKKEKNKVDGLLDKLKNKEEMTADDKEFLKQQREEVNKSPGLDYLVNKKEMLLEMIDKLATDKDLDKKEIKLLNNTRNRELYRILKRLEIKWDLEDYERDFLTKQVGVGLGAELIRKIQNEGKLEASEINTLKTHIMRVNVNYNNAKDKDHLVTFLAKRVKNIEKIETKNKDITDADPLVFLQSRSDSLGARIKDGIASRYQKVRQTLGFALTMMSIVSLSLVLAGAVLGPVGVPLIMAGVGLGVVTTGIVVGMAIANGIKNYHEEKKIKNSRLNYIEPTQPAVSKENKNPFRIEHSLRQKPSEENEMIEMEEMSKTPGRTLRSSTQPQTLSRSDSTLFPSASSVKETKEIKLTHDESAVKKLSK